MRLFLWRFSIQPWLTKTKYMNSLCAQLNWRKRKRRRRSSRQQPIAIALGSTTTTSNTTATAVERYENDMRGKKKFCMRTNYVFVANRFLMHKTHTNHTAFTGSAYQKKTIESTSTDANAFNSRHLFGGQYNFYPKMEQTIKFRLTFSWKSIHTHSFSSHTHAQLFRTVGGNTMKLAAHFSQRACACICMHVLLLAVSSVLHMHACACVIVYGLCVCV